ncbi:MAG: hypothetical protein PSX36_05695 [bacterium]|nr:hypothetical protein [bacterium]
MLKKVLIRFLWVGLIILSLDVVYTHTLYPKDLEEKSKEVVEIWNSQDSADIYYFGESSNTTYRETDSLKNRISEFTNWFYPSLRITNINKFATHGGVYRQWLKVIDTKKKLPHAIIITLNLRSFNAGWIHSNLETQLQEAMVFTQPFPNIVNRFFLSLQAFDNKTDKQREEDMLRDYRTVPLVFPYPFPFKTVSEWDSHMAAGGYLKPDGSWDMDKIVLACHFIKGYGFNIRQNNPRIADFDAIYDWCSKFQVNLYLNLLAENVQYADSLVGKDLVFLMKQNRDFLVKRYQKGNCKVIDNLEVVPGREFIDLEWTTEHYACKGRMTIAKNISDTLKKQFNNKYKKAY